MFRKRYTLPCFEKNDDYFHAEVPEWVEQAYRKMSDDIKYQNEHMEERLQKAEEARKALIESKKEQIKILKEGTVEQKIEIIAEKYALELKDEIEKLSGVTSLNL